MLKTNEEFFQSAMSMGVPNHTSNQLANYISQGIETGGFLHAVLTGDLFGAYSKADRQNIDHMFNIVNFLYNIAPVNCYGSIKKYHEWEGLK